MKRILGILTILSVLVTSCRNDEPQSPEPDAPALVSTSPEDGTVVPAGSSLSIVFVYDQNVQCASDSQKQVTVDNDASVEEVLAKGANLTVTLTDLRYGTDYTVSIPEGFVQGLYAEQKSSPTVLFHFSTKEFSFNGIQVEVGDNNGSFSNLYILNEGPFPGASTLDLLDFKKKLFCTDIFGQANPEVPQGLGNTGNDLAIVDGRLWVLLNASNQVAVLHLPDAKLERVLDVESPRYIIQEGGYAYITSYAGAVYQGDPVPGKVYRIDTKTFETKTVEVGYQPEGLAVQDGNLYVANSGGYNWEHDNRISVINLTTFLMDGHISTPVTNLFQMYAASGKIWFSSYGESTWTDAGDGNWIQSVSAPQCLTSMTTNGLFQFDVRNEIHMNRMTLAGKTLYGFGNDAEMTGGYDQCLYKVNTDTGVFQKTHFADCDLSLVAYPYGILVNPDNGDIYICDASFTGGSKLHCFDSKLKHKWTVDTGVGTGHLLLQ